MSTIPDPNSGPTLTVHDTAAARLLGELETLMQAVQGYGFVSRTASRRITPTATLPAEFLLAVAVALDSSEKLRTMAEITGDEIRQSLGFCNAYGPAADEVRLKSEGLQQAVRSTRHDVGGRALRAYRMARNFNTPKEEQQLVPHIENMKRLLARGPKKKTAKGQPTTANGVQKAPAGQNAPSGQTAVSKA